MATFKTRSEYSIYIGENNYTDMSQGHFETDADGNWILVGKPYNYINYKKIPNVYIMITAYAGYLFCMNYNLELDSDTMNFISLKDAFHDMACSIENKTICVRTIISALHSIQYKMCIAYDLDVVCLTLYDTSFGKTAEVICVLEIDDDVVLNIYTELFNIATKNKLD